MRIKSRSIRATSTITILIAVFAIHGNSDELETLIVDPSWHGNNRPVLTLEHEGDISDRNKLLFALEEHCRNVGDLPNNPDESCIAKLNDYFSDVPIWRSTVAMTYQGTRGVGHFSPYDGRATLLRYDELDFLLDDVPTWNDVFDGNEEDRLNTVAGVFADRACLALRETGRIQPSFENRCEARELFKYARYLDACITGFSRSAFFNAKNRRSGKSWYEGARETMNPNEVVDRTKGNGWHLVENYLLSILNNQKCMDLHFVTVEPYVANPSAGISSHSIGELQEDIKPMYDASMAIAARAGDNWAIQSYHEKQMRGDVAYWESVYEINPILFHRWMSSLIGARWYDNEERLLHAWQAYTLAKKYIPKLETIPFERFIFDRRGGFSQTEMKRVQNTLRRGNWKSDLEYPWNRVPDAFSDIQRNLRRYEESKQ